MQSVWERFYVEGAINIATYFYYSVKVLNKSPIKVIPYELLCTTIILF